MVGSRGGGGGGRMMQSSFSRYSGVGHCTYLYMNSTVTLTELILVH